MGSPSLRGWRCYKRQIALKHLPFYLRRSQQQVWAKKVFFWILDLCFQINHAQFFLGGCLKRNGFLFKLSASREKNPKRGVSKHKVSFQKEVYPGRNKFFLTSQTKSCLQQPPQVSGRIPFLFSVALQVRRRRNLQNLSNVFPLLSKSRK